jgi:hypothetical protein
MRRLVLALVLAACDGPTVPIDAAPVTVPTAPTETHEPLLPWGVRYARVCSMGSGSAGTTDGRHYFGCGRGSVTDLATGELLPLRIDDDLELVHAGYTIWRVYRINDPATNDLIVRDGGLRVVAAISNLSEWVVGPGPDGEVLVATETTLLALDLASMRLREVPGGRSCAWAEEVRLRDGVVECVSTEWIEVAADGDVWEERTTRVRTLDGRERIVDDTTEPGVRLVEGVLWVVDADGTARTRAFGEHAQLDDVRDGEALVSTEDAVLRVDLLSLDAELVASISGSAHFAGDEIVVAGGGGQMLVLARGASWTAPHLDAATPDGFTRLQPGFVDHWPVWVGDGSTYDRRGGAIAAFHAERGRLPFVTVSSLDPRELARAGTNDALWGAMLGARHVGVGSDTSLRVFRDGEGRRVFRGHTYVGGCERSHFDVRVRELDGALELTIVVTARRERVTELLGEIPDDALALSPWYDAYDGDPSIGNLDR